MRQPKSQKAKGQQQRPKATQQPSEIEDMEDLFSETDIKGIRASLLGWYALNHRDLPWRITEDDVEKRAYRVWVSELMLQQTRVQTVISYFDRWMLKWPTIRHLSQASMEEVNEMWAGLGYYRRARYLLEGAKKVVAEGGVFPKTVSSLRKIPGIGDYTSGAIASIAFKEVVPVVDGNVVRVIARLKAISANPKDSSTIKKFWHLATQLVDPIQPGDFNQALMELGATVCTPLSPSCSSCPVSSQCRALSISTKESSVLVTDYPAKVLKVKQRDDFSAVCVVEILGNEEISAEQLSNSKFLIIKRPEEGLLAGLWEFPSVLVDGEADLTARRKAIDQFLKKNFSIDSRKTCKVVLREHVGDFVHVFSHIRLKIYVEYLVLHLKGSEKHILLMATTMLRGSTGGAVAISSFPSSSSSSYFAQNAKPTSLCSPTIHLQRMNKFVIKSRRKIACFAVQESTTSTVDVENKEATPTPKSAPAKPKAAAKAPAKALPQMMEEDVIPSLKAIIEAQADIYDLELSFHDNRLEGSFSKKGTQYSFWAFFPNGDLAGPKGFSLSSYGSEASTVEPFLIDEKKITAKHVVFWVEKRLAAQGIIPVWTD